MTHFDFSFPDKKSKRKSIWQALNYFLYYIISTIALLYLFALTQHVGSMTDYEFIYKLCIFIGAPVIGAVVFAVWCIRIFRSKSIGVNIYEDRLEIVRYCPLGFSFRLKVIVPFSSIEKIETATVTEETVKNTQCQIYMPNGSECIIVNSVDKASISFCTNNNDKLISMVKKQLSILKSGSRYKEL